MNFLKALIIIAFLSPTASAIAQETDAERKDETSEVALRIGLNYKLTEFGNNVVSLWGGSALFELNRWWAVGGAGYGSSGNAQIGDAKEVELSYGGLLVEFSPLNGKKWGANLNLLAGLGNANSRLLVIIPSGELENVKIASDDLTVIELGAQLEHSIAHSLSLGLGSSYRYLAGTDMPIVSDSDLSGISYELTLRWRLQ